MPGPALTDTGLETVLVFRHGMDLPDFASFPLLDDPHGRELIAAYYRDHLRIAAELGAAIVLETPTWRANPDWGARQGYDHEALDRINQDAVAFVRGVADEFADVPVTVSGNLGPRGDAYAPEDVPTAEDSQRYHEAQIASFVAAGADRVTVLTITHAAEAVGIVRAAAAAEIPVVVSFTTETDGRLPSGQGLLDAVAEVDAATSAAALFYGINCAHPDHFSSALHAGDARTARIQLLRANASRMSHAELDESEELDDGDPDELAGQYRALLEAHPHLQILGGCCGTDPRHLHAIGRSCV